MRKHIQQIFLLLLCLTQFVYGAKSNNEPTTVAQSKELELLKNTYDTLKLKALNTYETDLKGALVYLDAAIETAILMKDAKKEFEAIWIKGIYNEEVQDYDTAIKYYSEAEKVAERLTYVEKNAICTDLAITYRKKGLYKLAQEYHNKALHLALQANDLEAIENSYEGLGTLFSLADDFDNAIKNYLQSLQYAEQRKNTQGIIISLKNISSCYRRMDDFKQAFLNIEKAYRMSEVMADKKIHIEVIEQYSGILGDSGRISEAFEKLDQGLALCEKDAKNYKKRYRLLIIKGDLLVRQNKFHIAETFFQECLKNQNALNNQSICKLNYELGNIYLHKNDKQKALFYLDNSLKISKEFNYYLESEKVHRKLYEFYKGEKQLDKALFHFEISNTLRDSIFNQEKTKRVQELEFRYQLEKSDKEIQSFKLRENNYLLYASICVFGVALAFLFYIVLMRGQNYKALKNKTEEIEQQNKKLEEANQVLHQFAYASAHDLKEPLRNIGSFVTLLQRRYAKDLPPEANEYMAYVTGGVKKMNNLLEDLLQYSTLTMNGKEVEKEEVKLEDVVREITQNLQSTIESRNATVVFDMNMANVYMSRLHTTQLLQNLISNAIKFVEDSPIVRIQSEEKNGNILISIQDNGIGIKKEYGDKIFNLFQRLHKNDIRFEGTGVGLAICKNIVDKYHGKIWFESVENKGTTFFINLPKMAA
jgi:signal transduction histidine kinase